MVKPAHPPQPRSPRTAPESRTARGLAVAAFLVLAGCMQTDPDPAEPAGKEAVDIPEDHGRRAGASSSTNWPTELGLPRNPKVFGKADTLLSLYFFEFLQVPPGGDQPVKMAGSLRFYRGGTIPALDTVPYLEYRFQETDTLAIPGWILDSLSTASDTAFFNIRIESDSLQGWLFGFSYSRRERKFKDSPFSAFPAKSVMLRTPTYSFKGNLRVDTAKVPPVAGGSEICFYIPGTPVFVPVGMDTTRVGPLPRGEYPLRFLRLTRLAVHPAETLIEAWEVKAGQKIDDPLLEPDEKVFSARVKGALSLRKAAPFEG